MCAWPGKKRRVAFTLLILAFVAPAIWRFEGSAAERPEVAGAPPGAKPDALQRPREEGEPAVALRFAGDDFTAKLPWFYHGLPFDVPRDHNVYSFEANALDLPEGKYTVAVVPKPGCSLSALSFDGETFQDVAVRDGRVELPGVGIRSRMLSFYVRADNAGGKGPLATVLVYPTGTTFADAKRSATRFARYRRDVRADDRAILRRENWGEFYAVLNRKGFGRKQLRAMFDRIVDWCKRRQVLDPSDLHHGAIYSEEDKYCFRDAAAAAVCFTHAWRDTGDEDYRRRALLARNYCYQGQHADAENKASYGAFAHMVRSFGAYAFAENAGAPGMQRLGGELPIAVGVETCIIANLLVKTYELGLEPSDDDRRRLRMAAEWVAGTEIQPGVFRHHEGATHDCQNATALGVQALVRAFGALEARGGDPPRAWLDAAGRGMRHYLDGQEAIGCWPYLFATIGRGQAFAERNLPDQGMGVYHWMVACQSPAIDASAGAEQAMRRAARWWLSMSRLDRADPMPTIDLDDREARGGLQFSRFTWCRFMAAASLMRIAEHTGEREPWQSLALRYMEHVDTKLRNETDPNKAPFKRATDDGVPVRTWVQAVEWAGVLLREIDERLEEPAR